MGFQLPAFLDPAAYLKGGAQFLEEISKPTVSVRKPAPKPRKPKGHRKLTVKTPSGRSSQLELADDLASNKEMLDLRHDNKMAVRHVEDRLSETEERFDKLLESLKVKEVIQDKKGGLGGLFSTGDDSGAPPSWVPMVPIAAIVADDFFDSAAPAAIGLGGLGLLRVMSGAPFSMVDALAFGLGGAVVFRKYQEGQTVLVSSSGTDS